jgi:hypothetical protein
MSMTVSNVSLQRQSQSVYIPFVGFVGHSDFAFPFRTKKKRKQKRFCFLFFFFIHHNIIKNIWPWTPYLSTMTKVVSHW